jgi:CRISPR-associated protein Cas5d
MTKNYSIELEISGPTAIWTRPDTGDAPVSYPGPTYAAVKGIFETVHYLQFVEVIPKRVEICRPIIFHTYNTNYGGPLRKSRVMQTGSGYQLLATVLINVCYKLYAEAREYSAAHGKATQKSEDWRNRTTSPGHAYQEMFSRRLKKGQWHAMPFLGWKEFTPDYLGPLRPETKKCSDVQADIPSMLYQTFSKGMSSPYSPEYRKVKIVEGAYDPQGILLC